MWAEVKGGKPTLVDMPDQPDPTYQDLRDTVDGYIERIIIADVGGGRTIDVWINEEGLLDDKYLPNVIIPFVYQNSAPIHGNILICAGTADGRSVGLTQEEADNLRLSWYEGLSYPVLLYKDIETRANVVRREAENMRGWIDVLGAAVIESPAPENMHIDRCRVCGERTGSEPDVFTGYCEEHRP